MKKIFVINGSASKNSSNRKIIDYFAGLTKDIFDLTVFDALNTLPHFNPDFSIHDTPKEILAFRQAIEIADAILICTPEYIFSIPSGLKNAIEWCVATSVFSEKPTGLITASASGEKGHAELQLIMKTVMTRFTPETTLLIQGVKGKFDNDGNLTDNATRIRLEKFTDEFITLVNERNRNHPASNAIN